VKRAIKEGRDLQQEPIRKGLRRKKRWTFVGGRISPNSRKRSAKDAPEKGDWIRVRPISNKKTVTKLP